MKYYKEYLEKKKYNVNLIKFSEKLNLNDYEMFKSADKLDLKPSIEYDNPNYLLNDEHHEKYNKKTKSFMFNNFYMWSKNELDILKGVKSTDKMNRERLPKGIKIPKLKDVDKTDNDYINDVIKVVDKEFSKNYGNTDNFVYPVTHKTAKQFLKDFITNKFKDFGPYQDFIRKGESYMFHSVLSSSINIGLINPDDIIKEIEKVKNKIPINSYEGYVRQLFWREYQLYCYNYVDFDSALKNPILTIRIK